MIVEIFTTEKRCKKSQTVSPDVELYSFCLQLHDIVKWKTWQIYTLSQSVVIFFSVSLLPFFSGNSRGRNRGFIWFCGDWSQTLSAFGWASFSILVWTAQLGTAVHFSAMGGRSCAWRLLLGPSNVACNIQQTRVYCLNALLSENVMTH